MIAMMKLLPLALLLLAFSTLTLTEVVNSFVSKSPTSQCHKFFIRNPKTKVIITPTVLPGSQYKQICQRWKKIYRFATLYDTRRRIPVYSAYRFSRDKQPANASPSKNLQHNWNNWKNEPQLENINESPDMTKISENEVDQFVHQAVNRDYIRSGYTRGHVFPLQYAADKEDRNSTYTFTNAAPQRQYNNQIWAAQAETPMKRDIETKCVANSQKAAYVVTGVVPGDRWIPITRKNMSEKNGVNIPSHFWTAYCCFKKNNKVASKAYLAKQNDRNDNTYELSKMSVKRLNENLTRFYRNDFSVFGDLCLI